MHHVQFCFFPRTRPAPVFCRSVVEVFERHAPSTCTVSLGKGLTSDQILRLMSEDLIGLGFTVELGKTANAKIKRPVFFGKNGEPALQYEIEAFHAEWRCGMELETGRAWMGYTIYSEIIQAMVMVDLEYLILAVPNAYKYQSGDRPVINKDFDKTCAVADALFGHSRVQVPYGLMVIGY